MGKVSETVSQDVYVRDVLTSSYTRSDMPGVTLPHNRNTNIKLSRKTTVTRVRDTDWKILVGKRSDASNPYFRRRITWKPKAAQLVATPWQHPQTGVWFSSRGSYVVGMDPEYPQRLIEESDDLALKDQALGRLKKKLAGRSNQMNALIPLVELRELRGLVTAVTFSLTDLVYALIRIKKTKGKSAAQWAAHAWLNWSFAIAPTASEIQQLSQSIDDFIKKSGGNSFTDYGVAKKTWLGNADFGLAGTLPGCNSRIKFEARHDLSYRWTAGYTTPVRSANNYSAAKDFGFEIGALVPALWELTAFSWLFDYFSTMGAFLEDAFVSDTTSTFYVCCTKKYTCTGEFSVGPPIGWAGAGSSSTTRSTSFEWFTTQREVYGNLPKRTLRFKTSDEIGKNAMNKLLNLGSILVGGRALSNKF